MKKLFVLLTVVVWGISVNAVYASDEAECPVGLVSGMTLDAEFGPGTQAITRCITKRNKLKVVYQINKECRSDKCAKPYAVGNIVNAIKDYEITHGMKAGKDYEVVAIVHSGGWKLILDNASTDPHASGYNLFQPQVQNLLDKGVKILFCQNTARNKNVKTSNMIAGVGYVTAGVTAIADLQAIGYNYVQP